MFTGTISHEGAEEPPRQVIEEAVQCAMALRSMRGADIQPWLAKSYELADGTQVYVFDLEHVWRIHIIPPLPTHDAADEPRDRHTFPLFRFRFIAGFLSGAMHIRAMDEKEEGEADPPGWYMRNNWLALQPESAELFSIEEASYKLAVHEYPPFTPNRGMDETVYSQYATVEPGKYTGGMASVVQLLLGVGKLLDYDYEQRWIDADPENRAPLLAKGVDTDPITGEVLWDEPLPPRGFYDSKAVDYVQLQYDWRWNRTHGLLWGDSNEGRLDLPALIEIGQRGIFAMPFPVDEDSKEPAVQARYEEVYPDLALFAPFKTGTETLFEALGGFPTGENFPSSTAELDRWVRAGYAWQCPIGAGKFYDEGMFMSSGFGWAFHSRLPRAVNTMYTINEAGQKVGHCYELLFTLREKPEEQKVRNTLTGLVIQTLGLTDRVDIYKAGRLPQEFAEQMVNSPDYAEFDAFVVSPDVTLVTRLVLLRSGIIDFYALPPVPPPQFKYFEHVLQEVVFFFFNRAGENVPIPDRADGPIFAAYVDEKLEILHFYAQKETPPQPETINTRQECQFVGTWEENTYGQREGVAGNFYTSSRDFRLIMREGSGVLKEFTAERVGEADRVGASAVGARLLRVNRHYYGVQWVTTTVMGTKSYRSSVSCASNDRSIFFAMGYTHDPDARVTEEFSGRLHLGISGITQYFNLYNFMYHWIFAGIGDDRVSIYDFEPPYSITGDCFAVWTTGVGTPDACFWDVPAAFNYSVCCVPTGYPWIWNFCPLTGNYRIEINSPDGSLWYNKWLTPQPVQPPAYVIKDEPVVKEELEVYGFGHPLMHNKALVDNKCTNSSGCTPYSSWWAPKFFGESAPWRAIVNYYGPPYVGTALEFTRGWVDFGYRPPVIAHPVAVEGYRLAVFFGVVK